jgi:carboxymethylenebutenolidase
MVELKAECLFVFGLQDLHVPFAGRQRIRDRLEAVSASYEWHEVNAAHAFLRDEGPRYDPAPGTSSTSSCCTTRAATIWRVCRPNFAPS